jgi:serine/threonine-protein kinase
MGGFVLPWRVAMTETQDIIDYLVSHGAYVEAAKVCVERGEIPRAIQLLERVWHFADAVPLALSLGDRALAVRLSLDAGDPSRATEIADQIDPAARQELSAASEAFASRGRHFEAARLAERALELERAAHLYRRANALLEAGRVLELAGESHQAGILYESLAAHGGEDEAAAARLALGRLLGRLGRHEEAARMLQAAVRHPRLHVAAQRALCVELLSLGFRVAATEVLTRLRREDPQLPPFPEALAAAELALPALASQTASDAGLLRRRFRIIRLLGAGATGRVYLADDTLLGRKVAVKLLAVGAGASGPERQAYFRFAREAEAAGRLRHPNIVTLYDLDQPLGLFVLEHMAGGTLAERLSSAGPLSPAAARRLALDLLAALATAHERGIIHRDIKPANVFFDAAGNAKLGDFGAAHLIDFGQTQTGGLVGTVAYMAPEQITGSAIGAAADVYALGITLFEALTGRCPFLGPDIVAQHLAEPAPDLLTIRPELSPAHQQVIARALSKEPSARFASADEMAEAVREWPTEISGGSLAAAAEDQATAPPSEGSAVTAQTAADQEAAAGLEVGRTPAARLIIRRDERVGRLVLVEEREEPLDAAGVERVRALAAAGGPFVQRVLALSEDRRSTTYEVIEGPLVAWDELPDSDKALLAPVRDALIKGGVAEPDRAVRTAGGPVLLIAPSV